MGGRHELQQEIVDALARGATILTGNQRAARTLRHHFDRRCHAQGLSTWGPPAIFAWDTFTAGLWQQLLLSGHTSRLLLNRVQEHAVWRAVIAADPDLSRLHSVDVLTELAVEAWSRLCAYRGEDSLRTLGVSADTRAFQRWALAVQQRCRAAEYLLAGQLEAALLPALAAGHLPLPSAGYLLVGFDDTTPAMQAVVQALRAAGASVTEIDRPQPAPSAALVAAENGPDEMHTAARWIRRHLEDHPSDQVALIVPDLEGRRALLDRTLRQVLAPELQEITASPSASPFEFSLGIALAKTPLVAAALDLLAWTLHPLPLERVSQLLLSPYFAEGREFLARASFDAYELRRARMLRPELSLDALLDIMSRAHRSTRLPQTIAALKAMRRLLQSEAFNPDKRRSAGEWSDSIQRLLHAAGWAGGNDSIEFQTRRRWQHLLDELATLDFEGARLTFRDTLTELSRLAHATLFAPESRNAPVQVMGPLEAAGSTFDALWFLGAADLTWPPRPGTSPLLAWSLQRELGMPGTDPVQDAEAGRRVTTRLAQSAAHVVFSYARETAEGRQRPSRLLAGITQPELAAAALLPPEAALDILQLEAVADHIDLPYPPDQVLRGGADLLKQQAACGFRAFAERRLWSKALDTVTPGMDARESGSIVHGTMQHFWNEVANQAALRDMSSTDRQTVLARSIDHALQKVDALRTTAWDAAYVEVQRERLMNLLEPWLTAELQRTIPFTVRQSETDLRDVHVGPLRLHLRVDRVDETEFGDVILDYKTGAANPSAWLTERPDEPQLPLYAILSEAEQLAGVAFAHLRAGKDMGLSGYQTQAGILLRPTALKETATLEDQVDLWRETLTRLAEDFYRGDVRVRPKEYPTTCAYCAQRLLCRLDLSLLGGEQDEAEDETEADPG